jgi:hypothetical protein
LWCRLRAEIHFAQGSYAAAVRAYLETLVQSTAYFTSSQHELDDKLIVKMARSLSELHFHTYSLALSQIGEPTDYSTCFKQLEERQSNDVRKSL